MSTTSENTFSFRAETQKVLKIIINSLYQHKEVFLRELISNSSDALNKIRIKQLTSEKIADPELEHEINIIIDKENNLLTISDTGIGMTQKELRENLGTIARSGTAQFLEALEKSEGDSLIGMFGVGFYSAFLVAEEVSVETKSFSPSSRAWMWNSNGEDSFSISESSKETRGTEVKLKIREDFEEYLSDYRIKEIVKKYSNYVEFPIKLEEEILNDQTALWRVSSNEVTEEQYEEYFRHLGQFGKPLIQLHVSADVPIEFYSILYVPSVKPRNLGTIDRDYGLRLYNRKILIEDNNKELLPEYLRFIVGVVDAEDLQLNVSREVLQTTRVQKQINTFLQKKVLRELEKMAKDNSENYSTFWKEFGPFIKEGIASNDKNKDKLVELLRFHSISEEGKDGSLSLAKYVENMKVGQEEIYYLSGLDLDILRQSPHLEYYNKEGYDVLLLGESIDSFLMMNLTEYNDKKFFLIDQDESEEVKSDSPTKSEDDEDEEAEPAEKTGPFAPLMNKAIEVLGSKVADVKTSDRLIGSVARLVTPKGGISSDLQRAMKIMEANSGSPSFNAPMMGKILQINPEHEIIKSLNDLIQNNPENPLISDLIEQLHDNARIADGDVPDFNSMLPRLEKIMAGTLSNQT